MKLQEMLKLYNIPNTLTEEEIVAANKVDLQMSNVSRGLGATLAVGATPIGTITKVSSPAMKRAAIDITTLDAIDGFQSFIAGLADPGLFSVEGFLDTADTGQMLLYEKFKAGTVDTYTITFPAIVGASWTASCYIQDLDLGNDADLTKAISFKATFKISGEPDIGTSATSGLSNLTLTGTGGALAPSFNNAKYAYSYIFNTSTSITITPGAAAQQTYTMYVDGVLIGTYNTGSVSAAIAFGAAISKKVDIIVSKAGYTPLVYTIIAVRTS